MSDDRLTMVHHGYDGVPIVKGDRVELHPGTDLWMRGARFGDLEAIFPNGRVVVKLDRAGLYIATTNRVRRIDP